MLSAFTLTSNWLSKLQPQQGILRLEHLSGIKARVGFLPSRHSNLRSVTVAC
jgi:hypothetical protein